MENKTISMLAIAATLAVLLIVQTHAASATNNGFSDAVKSQAQNQQKGSFGAQQAEAAHTFGGLGGLNCNTCTPLKGG
jgi:hypothetical protein